jgi:hypothetical protein
MKTVTHDQSLKATVEGDYSMRASSEGHHSGGLKERVPRKKARKKELEQTRYGVQEM